MGSAIIKSNLGNALYSVELVKSEAKVLARKTAVLARQIVVDTAIAAKENELAAAQLELENKLTALSNRMAEMNANIVTVEVVQKAQKDALAAETAVTVKRREIALLKLEKISLAKELVQIETALAKETRNAWCADNSMELTGTVGTIEMNGEAATTLLMPGGSAGAGLLQHPLSETPAGVFVNLAKLPAWQKWKPTYRDGIITALDTVLNTAAVNLGNDLSSAQNLPINQAQVLTDVPVIYLD